VRKPEMNDERNVPEADDAVERPLTTATAIEAESPDPGLSIDEASSAEAESEAPESEAPESEPEPEPEPETLEPGAESSTQENETEGELEPLEPSIEDDAATEPETVSLEEAVIVDEVTAQEEAHEAPEAETPIEIAEPSEPPEASGDPFRGPGDWYVVHTYAGYENKVKANLESRIHTMQMEGKIFRVHIPMEDVMEIKSGKKQIVQKKVFPGYLLVKMFYDNDSWYVVRNTPGVTGFVSAGTGSKPTPLSKREVEKILVVKKEEQKPAVRLGFEENDVVRITSGPFADFNGTISEINPDQGKLKVLVNIFDRETPVELSFDQVSKV